MKKKVIVVGGGISGLTAGIYAQKSGFDVAILESHSIAGGFCTAWKRKGYLFEGCIHWLTGTNENEPMNKLWRYVGALNDDVKIHYNDPHIVHMYKDTPILIYRDVDKTERHWLDISPEDEKHIRTLFRYVRQISNLVMPLFTLRGLKASNKYKQSIPEALAALRAVKRLKATSKISGEEFFGRFAHEGLREAMQLIAKTNSSIRYFVLYFSTLNRGSGGFVEGGAIGFIARMVKTFEDLGGEISYNTKVERVLVENNKATGVVVGGKQIDADAVIVTVDTMVADTLFDIPLDAPWLSRMRSDVTPLSAVFVSLGINADLSDYPHIYSFRMKQPINIFSHKYYNIKAYNYAKDSYFSPKGKTALTVILPDNKSLYDDWVKVRDKGLYEEEKHRIGTALIEVLSAQIPEIAGNVEVVDVATPLTFERYCSSWKGSWMTAPETSSMRSRVHPSVIEGLSGVYFGGHRMQVPGGLPVAAKSGRTAVMHLCRDTNTVFAGEG